MPGGQPTKYKPEFCDKLIKYFDIEPWEIVGDKRVYRRMPSLTRFAKKIKVGLTSIYNWSDKNHDSFQPEFLKACNRAKQIRKEWLIDVGLSGLAPANSFKFVAVNCTDMKDKQEQEQTHRVKVEIIDEKLEAADSKALEAELASEPTGIAE